jgi:O-antigen/teichoic acid export membrane protein
VYGQILYSYGGYKDFIWISGSALLVNVVLNLLLIPRIGERGAAAATTAGYLTSSILHTLLAFNRTGRRELWFSLLAGTAWFTGTLCAIAAGWSPLLVLACVVVAGLLTRFILPGDLSMIFGAIRARFNIRKFHG